MPLRGARFGEIPKPTVKEATPQSGWEKARLLWTICVPPREILGGIFIAVVIAAQGIFLAVLQTARAGEQKNLVTAPRRIGFLRIAYGRRRVGIACLRNIRCSAAPAG